MKDTKVAIIGQGRSGRDIHGAFLKSENNKFFEVVAVVELDEQRRSRALEEYPGCTVYSSYTELFERDDIDFVINATLSNDHYAITKDLILHGLNVLVEKPMARNRYECDDLIRCANEKGVILAVFQQSFFAPFYIFAKELCESGKLGDVKQINISYNAFARRWDWQTLQCRMAGSIYNTGPHPIGFALGFLGFDDNAEVRFSRIDTAITSGDAEDYAKIIITAPGKPVIDVEMISIDAYPETTIKIMGTKGTFKSSTTEYEMKYIIDGENVTRPVVFDSLKDENGYPIYCSEKLEMHEESGKFDGTAFDIGTRSMYEMIRDRIKNGTPFTVTPEMASKIIGVIEKVHAENPLPVLY
ncbi:MAG: Gfo/Idh/MocA family oxidoreductase [Clostridia bacterium]|nr:Gfo/Idh/MocA family oxidoreductase [Clostridia bacterium]